MLPEGWLAERAEDGREYYTHHSFGGVATWDRPCFLPAGWEHRIDSSTGRTWYQNVVSGESVWERPAGSSTEPPTAAPAPAPAPTPPLAPVPAEAAAAAQAETERAERAARLAGGSEPGATTATAEQDAAAVAVAAGPPAKTAAEAKAAADTQAAEQAAAEAPAKVEAEVVCVAAQEEQAALVAAAGRDVDAKEADVAAAEAIASPQPPRQPTAPEPEPEPEPEPMAAAAVGQPSGGVSPKQPLFEGEEASFMSSLDAVLGSDSSDDDGGGGDGGGEKVHQPSGEDATAAGGAMAPMASSDGVQLRAEALLSSMYQVGIKPSVSILESVHID
jgi:hypothetical protein